MGVTAAVALDEDHHFPTHDGQFGNGGDQSGGHVGVAEHDLNDAAVGNHNGRKITDFALAAPPTYEGIAIAGGRLFVSLQDGSLVCFGN